MKKSLSWKGGFVVFTGGCYSADEIPNLQMCPKGYYVNRQQSNSCQKCPCPEGEACYVIPGTQEVMCARCPQGTTGEEHRVKELGNMTQMFLKG